MSNDNPITPADIVVRLNEYEASHDHAATSGPKVHNIWDDVIVGLWAYSERVTDVIDEGKNDQFGLFDGTVIRYDTTRRDWGEAGGPTFTVNLPEEEAEWLAEFLRIGAGSAGRVELSLRQLAHLVDRDREEDGFLERDKDGVLQMWISGLPYNVESES